MEHLMRIFAVASPSEPDRLRADEAFRNPIIAGFYCNCNCHTSPPHPPQIFSGTWPPLHWSEPDGLVIHLHIPHRKVISGARHSGMLVALEIPR
jgi:hypothetical protein